MGTTDDRHRYWANESFRDFPPGRWVYPSGPSPAHRLNVPRATVGVLARREHMCAATRRVVGDRWRAPRASSGASVRRPLHRPLHRPLVRTLSAGRNGAT